MMFWDIVLPFITGIAITVCTGAFFVYRYISNSPKRQVPEFQQYDEEFTLPPEVRAFLANPEELSRRESCFGINLILNFVLSQIKNTKRFRNIIQKLINKEIQDVLKKIPGGLVSSITTKELSFGKNAPIITGMKVEKITLNNEATQMKTLVLSMGLEYAGGFRITLLVQTLKKCYLSINVRKVKANLRLAFSTHPYPHWSVTCYEEPELDIDLDTYVFGRSLQKVANLIVTQIKRTIRKKHTLPAYKIRYAPFFLRPDQNQLVEKESESRLMTGGQRLTVGPVNLLNVRLDRAPVQPSYEHMYYTVILGNVRWLKVTQRSHSLLVRFAITLSRRTGTSPIGLLFASKSRRNPGGKLTTVITVETIIEDSIASRSPIQRGDILVNINSIAIKNPRQASKICRDNTELQILVDRNIHTAAPTMPPAVESSLRIVPSSTTTTRNTGQPPRSRDSSAERNADDERGRLLFPTLRRTIRRTRKFFTRQNESRSEMSVQLGGRSLETSVRSAHSEAVITDDSAPSSAQNSDTEDSGLRRVRRHSDTDLEHWNLVEMSQSDVEQVQLRSVHCMNSLDVPPSTDAEWVASNLLHADSTHRYLTLLIWANGSTPARFNRLIGHVCWSLEEIVEQSLRTEQATALLTQSVQPEQQYAHSRDFRTNEFAQQRGFVPELMYGSVTVIFKCQREITEQERANLLNQLDRPAGTGSSPSQDPPTTVNRVTSQRNTNENKHFFLIKHFPAATSCDHCLKKIWMKTGSECSECGIVCHNKCREEFLSYSSYCSSTRTTSASISEPEKPVSPSTPSVAAGVLDKIKSKIQPKQGSPDERAKPVSKTPLDELVTLAKTEARELWSSIDEVEREAKLQEMISKLESELVGAQDTRDELMTQLALSPDSPGIQDVLLNCEQKIQALSILMLQHCHALQMCNEENSQTSTSGDLSSSLFSNDDSEFGASVHFV